MAVITPVLTTRTDIMITTMVIMAIPVTIGLAMVTGGTNAKVRYKTKGKENCYGCI